MFVKPTEKGRGCVPMPGPARRMMPDEGAHVPSDAMWHKQIADGYVVPALDPEEAVAKAAAEEPADPEPEAKAAAARRGKA